MPTGFLKSTSTGTGGTGGGTFTPTATTVVDNASGIANFDASTGSIKFTDDANLRTDVIIKNFGSDDRIYSNSSISNYSFALDNDDPDDLVITFNNNGVLNQIVLDEIFAGKEVFVDSIYESAKAAVGFDFLVFG